MLRLPISTVIKPASTVETPVASVPVNTTPNISKPAQASATVVDIKAVTSIEQLQKLTQLSREAKAADLAAARVETVKFSILEQDAHEALKLVVDTLKENKPLLYAALHACSIKPTEKGITLIAANTVQQAQIEREGETVLRLLREALKEEINMHVEADAENANTHIQKVPYTANEKFEYLANKNPLLRKLKDDFNMDIS